MQIPSILKKTPKYVKCITLLTRSSGKMKTKQVKHGGVLWMWFRGKWLIPYSQDCRGIFMCVLHWSLQNALCIITAGPPVQAWNERFSDVYQIAMKCQPMVISANSAPTGIPNLGCSKEVNLIQCKTVQLWYSTAVWTAQWCFSSIKTQAQLWNSTTEASLEQGCHGARPLSGWTALGAGLLHFTLLHLLFALV